MRIYTGAAVSLVFFAVVTYIAQSYFNFEGQSWYMFLLLMGTLGLTSSALFYVLQEKWEARKAKAAEGAAGGGEAAAGGSASAGSDDAQQWVRDANARLAQSRPGVGIENLPVIFVMGDRGTAKTSVLLNSGLEPELLAGNIYQDNAIAPTRGANIFFARDNVFVEAGGAVLANPAAWKSLVTKLRPGRLKALGKGSQAPRGVVLCFDLETFSRQGAGDQISAAARYIQERLGEISQELGISFPVYVLFTRADRVPFFADFVANLTIEEAGQAVGVTVPLRPASGVYAEGETQRLTAAFNSLFHTFCDQRLRLLPREADPQRVPGAYEFPREFRKLRQLMVQFLVDVGRPSQLRVSPFLRGFYFSGVRPVLVQDVQAPAASSTPKQQEYGGGATGMFRAGFQAEQKAQQMHASAGQSQGRRVPQWLFLGHLFNDVILADTVARAASGSSLKTSMTKRLLLASVAGLSLIYAGLLTWSYFGNSALEDQAITAAKNIAATEAIGSALPGEDALRRLDSLRASLQALTEYEANGAPLKLRWGLYAGSRMLPNVRRLYYQKFRQLLFGMTQDQMLAYLQRVPPVPGPSDDYGFAYDSLKAYLLTTSEWKRSSDAGLQSFLGSRLYARWSNGREPQIGAARLQLAKAQFEFYGKDLHNGNPYAETGDTGAVDRSRQYLAKFSGVERVYRFLLSESAKGNPPMTFNSKFPGSAAAVTSTVEVSWAYTREGWKWMQDQIRKANFGGEVWVLGSGVGQSIDKGAMEKGILEFYTRDYIEQWRNVLRRSNVARYANLQDASKKLTLLTSSNAPLLALFWWTSYHTAVDLPGVAEKFKAVQVVSPFSANQQYIVAANQTYNNGLLNLQQAVDRAANKEPNGEQAMRDSAQGATLNTRQLAVTFPPDPEGRMEQRSEELLMQPIKYLDGLTGGDLRSEGGKFCLAFNALTNKFPFNPLATPEVSLQELGDILAPNTGKLWLFYNTTLKTAMQCQNGQCTSSGNPPLNPQFVRFIGQLMQFSKALYGDAGTDPNYKYALRPQTSDQVDVFDTTINGANAKLRGGQQAPYVWPGTGARGFQLTLNIKGGSQLQVQSWDGLWAVFRFFADADRTTPSGPGYVFGWSFRQGRGGQSVMVGGRPLTYELFVDTAGGPAVFSKDFLSTLKCVGPLTR